MNWLVRIMLVQTLVIFAIFASMTASRVQGCERSKADRRDNAIGWRIAEARARSQGQIGFSLQYKKLAQHLESRSNLNCLRTAIVP